MSEPAPPPTHRLAPTLTRWPELRRPVARLHLHARTLHELLLASFPVANSLVRDRTIAERTNSTPYDHLAADTIAAVCQLVDVLDGLARPITLVAPAPARGDDIPF